MGCVEYLGVYFRTGYAFRVSRYAIRLGFEA